MIACDSVPIAVDETDWDDTLILKIFHESVNSHKTVSNTETDEKITSKKDKKVFYSFTI